MTEASTFNSDFYVTAASVIPIIFLGLILEGGLWDWIAGRIRTGGSPTPMVRVFVSVLQVLAILILAAGSISEIIALFALLRQRASSSVGYAVFCSIVFLILMLGLVLAARIPGVFIVGSDGLTLELKEGEDLLWSCRTARLVFGPTPWLWGGLFVTDARIVWLTSRELGLLAAPTVEIQLEQLVQVDIETSRSSAIRYLPSNSSFLYLPPVGIFVDVTDDAGRKYHFCVRAELDDVIEHIKEAAFDANSPDSSLDG